MTQSTSAGARFRHALASERPLQIVGTINAYCGLLAENAGFRAIYLSGAGVANASFGVPDLGITTMNDVVEDIQRITSATRLPLLVDADTGWGTMFSIARTVKSFTRAGAAGLHIEDQQAAKRCGHRPGKALVEAAEMVDRIRAATDARVDEDFFILARTDALAAEGLDATLQRCHQYIEAGADGIFAEAVTQADQYREFCRALNVPVLANMTEFGQTPLLTTDELAGLGVAMALYPLSAFRAMSAAAETVYNTIRSDKSQRSITHQMQSRQRLYEILDYQRYEKLIDEFLNKVNS